MRIEAKSILYDIHLAVNRIQEFTRDASLADYQGNAMMRSAVERQCEIIGEAVNRLSQIDSDTASRITAHRRIVNFRNQLIHGYFVVDDRAVWDVVQVHLPTLGSEVEALLQED